MNEKIKTYEEVVEENTTLKAQVSRLEAALKNALDNAEAKVVQAQPENPRAKRAGITQQRYL